jgi:glycopeptide antibiotics resistance protein
MIKQRFISIFTTVGTKKYIPGIAWFFLTLIAISIPGKQLPKFGAWFEQISFDKLIHTFLFGMLAVFVMLPVALSNISTTQQKNNWFIKVALGTAIWGLIAELIQKYFIPMRSYDVVDLMANTLGALIAFAIFRAKFGKTAP